jgi:hypothetical protein
MKKITVIIPYFYKPDKYGDRRDYLENCLMSLQMQTVMNFEVMIVGEHYPSLCRNVLVDDHRYSLGKILNRGVEEVYTEFIHFSQTEFIFPPDHFEKVEQRLDKSKLLFFPMIRTKGEIFPRKFDKITSPDQADGLDSCLATEKAIPFAEEFRGVYTHYYVHWLSKLWREGLRFEYQEDMPIIHQSDNSIYDAQRHIPSDEGIVSWGVYQELLKNET